MIFLLNVVLGATLSFIGSLPLGIINLTAADLSLRKGPREARIYAFGASLVEFIQAFLALRFTQFLLNNRQLDLGFQVVAAVVFFILALYYLFWAPPIRKEVPDRRSFAVPSFWKGVFVSSLNLMVFPYWMFYGSFLRAEGWISSTLSETSFFCSGVFLGTFLLLLVYIRLADRLKSQAMSWSARVNHAIGGIFLLFLCYQIWKILSFLPKLW